MCNFPIFFLHNTKNKIKLHNAAFEILKKVVYKYFKIINGKKGSVS
jgi:hypothetical protein